MTRHTAALQEIQHKRIDRMFGDRTPAPTEVQMWETTRNINCDIHGRRGSGGSVRSLSQRRDSNASSLYGGGGGSKDLPSYNNKRDSIGSTILLNNSASHWKNSFKRDSSVPATSASLYNLASDLKSSMARIESLDSPVDRSTRATTPARTKINRDSSSSFSNGVRRTSMPVLNQR